MSESNFRERLRYRFDAFMTKGSANIFMSLVFVFLVTFFLLGFARMMIFWIFPDQFAHWSTHVEQDIGMNWYITFLELTDPGNMAQDIETSPLYKVVGVCAGIAGIIMLSALIAFLTTGLDQKIHELKRGHSKVIEEDHTLILGWNEQRIVEILRELITANESEDDACVVILADKDKEDMDDILRLRVQQRKTTRIVTRSGSVTSFSNLEVVSVATCKSAIILAGCEDSDTLENKSSSDAKVIQTTLALTTITDSEFCIVAEIFNQRHRGIIQHTFEDRVVTVDTNDILAKILVQTSRSIGLSTVYNEILSFDGCELYFHNTDWGGIQFGAMAFHFPDGVPMGVRHGDGKLLLNPPIGYIMKDDDDILILADDDSTIDFKEKALIEPKELDLSPNRADQHKEEELIMGWTDKSPIIVEQYADYVLEDSKIDVMLSKVSEADRKEIEAVDASIEGVKINILEMDQLDEDQLLSIRPFHYDNIIILAEDDGNEDIRQVDSENLVTLLLLRSIFNEHAEEAGSTKLITEVLDSQNYQLVSKAGVKDVVISNRIVSMILAQVSESRDIIKVYEDIFEEDGSEIYLKPASLYFTEFPAKVTFADIMRIAQKRAEVCLGVKLKEHEDDTKQNCGVTLIPLKDAVYELNECDSLVVLAEDEL